jgi:hypothetical protein
LILNDDKTNYTRVKKASWVSTNNYVAWNCFVSVDNDT